VVIKADSAKKVSIYVGEDDTYHGNSLYAAILDYLFYRGVAGASVVRGIAGFGSAHQLHTTRILRLAENLPVVVEFIESPEKVADLLPKLREMTSGGLIEVQDTMVVKPAETSSLSETAASAPRHRMEGRAKLMRIYVGESDRWRDKPLYRALVECMRANDIAGATVYQGILGYGANRRIHQQKALSLSHDLPIMLSAVDTAEKIGAFLPLLDEMVMQGLVVLSDVSVVKYEPRRTRANSGAEEKQP
jgi:PII-like signaling protein